MMLNLTIIMLKSNGMRNNGYAKIDVQNNNDNKKDVKKTILLLN